MKAFVGAAVSSLFLEIEAENGVGTGRDLSAAVAVVLEPFKNNLFAPSAMLVMTEIRISNAWLSCVNIPLRPLQSGSISNAG